MATFNFVFTYPDAQKARILAALKKHFTVTVPGEPSVPLTDAQAAEKLRLMLAENVKKIVFDVERSEGIASAIAATQTVDVV